MNSTKTKPPAGSAAEGFEGFENHAGSPTNAPRHSITPRQRRALQALLRGPQTTLRLRHAIGCINVADVVMRLRRRGLTLPREDVKVIDRDERVCTVGRYSLTREDAKKAREWLGGGGGEL